MSENIWVATDVASLVPDTLVLEDRAVVSSSCVRTESPLVFALENRLWSSDDIPVDPTPETMTFSFRSRNRAHRAGMS